MKVVLNISELRSLKASLNKPAKQVILFWSMLSPTPSPPPFSLNPECKSSNLNHQSTKIEHEKGMLSFYENGKNF